MDAYHIAKPSRQPAATRVLGAMLLTVLALSACGDKQAKKPGQALASVNGEEITVLQLNEELQRAGQAAKQDSAKKQLLEALIDRQLLESEAAKDKLDRDPKVMQAIERAKSLIVAQAYMQKRLGTQARPDKAEVEAYFNGHPQFFTNRKQFDMRELVIASRDMNDDLKRSMDSAKSLEEVAVWLDANKVKYARAQLSRTSADLPPELSAKLLAMPKGQLFIIREGERSMLIQIADIKDNPVTLETATPQIEQFLFNKKNKEAADAEIKRLRATAKIEYFNKADAPGATPATPAAPASPAATAVAPAADPSAAAPLTPAAAPLTPAADSTDASTARGVAGLK